MIPPDPIRPDVSRQGPEPSLGWLLNHLVLAASAKGYQQDRPGIADEDRITDADIEKIEAQILALASASASPHPENIAVKETTSLNDLEQCIAELTMAKQFLHDGGTDPEAWIDGVILQLRALRFSLGQLRELAEPGARQEQGWLPIDSAPTGQRVLVFVPDFENYISGVFSSVKIALTGRWVTLGKVMQALPTHWRPLPDPPSALPASEGREPPADQKTPDPKLTDAELAEMRADFYEFVKRRNVSPEVMALMCPWLSKSALVERTPK